MEHLEDVHAWPRELIDPDPSDPYLDLLHAALHDQDSGHVHQWVIVEFHSGSVVSPPLDTEVSAQARAMDDFGPDAGKEYGVCRYVASDSG